MVKSEVISGRVSMEDKSAIESWILDGIVFSESDAVKKGIRAFAYCLKHGIEVEA